MSLVAAVLAGCAVPPEAGFPDVAKLSTERTGSRVHWNQGTPEDAAVREHVKGLLAATLTADAAVQVALLNNRRLQATYEELMVAQADLVQAGLLTNPTIHGEVRFPIESGEGTALEFGLMQNFIGIFQRPLRQKIAGAAFEAAKLRVTGEVVDHAARTRAAFYEVQAAEQQRELRETVLAANEAGYDIAKRLREAGNTTALELAMSRMQYEQTKMDLAMAEVSVLRARARLDALMGVHGADTTWRIAPRMADPPPSEMDLARLESRAVARNLDLAALRQDTLRALGERGFARVFTFVPDLYISGHAEREPGGEWTIGPELEVPIPIFDQGQARVASADARVRQTRETAAALAVEVRAAVRGARARLVSARQRIDYYKAVMLPLRQEILDQTQLQYNAMQVGPVQLLQSREQQVDTAGRYLEEILEYWLARTELEQIVNGRLVTIEGPARRPMGGSSEPQGSGGH